MRPRPLITRWLQHLHHIKVFNGAGGSLEWNTAWQFQSAVQFTAEFLTDGWDGSQSYSHNGQCCSKTALFFPLYVGSQRRVCWITVSFRVFSFWLGGWDGRSVLSVWTPSVETWASSAAWFRLNANEMCVWTQPQTWRRNNIDFQSQSHRTKKQHRFLRHMLAPQPMTKCPVSQSGR